MAKTKKTEETPMELTVESLMSAGFTQEDAEAIVGSNSTSGGGLPYPLIKVNYDLTIPELAKFGDFVSITAKDDNGDTTSLINFGDRLHVVILASVFQYSRYNAATNSADISSNLFPMKDTKKAIDLKTGKRIADLKKNDPDNKIKYQEIMLLLVSSDSQPEPKPYIFYNKGAFMYSFGQCRKPLTNRGAVMYNIEFGLKQERKGKTKYFVVDENTFVATPRTLEEIKEGATIIPAYIKAFNDWVDSVNSGADSKPTKETPVYEEDDDDEIAF